MKMTGELLIKCSVRARCLEYVVAWMIMTVLFLLMIQRDISLFRGLADFVLIEYPIRRQYNGKGFVSTMRVRR